MLIAEIVRVVNEGDAATFFQSGTLNLEVRELCIFLCQKVTFLFLTISFLCFYTMGL